MLGVDHKADRMGLYPLIFEEAEGRKKIGSTEGAATDRRYKTEGTPKEHGVTLRRRRKKERVKGGAQKERKGTDRPKEGSGNLQMEGTECLAIPRQAMGTARRVLSVR